MENRESAATRGLVRRVTLPLIAVSLVGGMATMLGRSKRDDRTRIQRADFMKSLNDPKVRAALDAAQRAIDEARTQISSRDGRRVQEQLSKRTGAAVDTLQPTVKDAGERARELAERLRAEGQVRIPELNQRLREDIAPRARSFAEEAITEAEEILSDARQRATELSKNARSEYGPDITNKASALAGLVAAGSSAGYHMLRERAGDIASQGAKKGPRKMTRRGRGKVSSALQAAGHQTKYVATESIMVGAWAGLLGATIYFALLTHDQRERLKNFFGNIVSQVQDVFTDFQDGTEDVQSSTR